MERKLEESLKNWKERATRHPLILRGARREILQLRSITSSRWGDIIPVEVKSGATGSLKSLNFFLNEKKRDFAVRFNMDEPSLLPNAESADSLGRKRRYSLLSLPMYMVCQLKRLVREAKGKCCQWPMTSSNEV